MAVDKNIKILLVEDAGVMRKMEIKTLNSLDFNNVSEAENGKDAIELLMKKIRLLNLLSVIGICP